MKKNRYKNCQKNQQHALNFQTFELFYWNWAVCSIFSAVYREFCRKDSFL